MQEFFLKHKKRIIGAGIAILVLVTVIASGIKLNATLLESAIGVVVTPFQDLTTGISSWIDDTVTSARNKTKLKDENEELKQQIAELKEELKQYDGDEEALKCCPSVPCCTLGRRYWVKMLPEVGCGITS